MIRYSVIGGSNKREIVLLKGHPCFWSNCSFCDYTHDNCEDSQFMTAFNERVLQQVKGMHGALEVINSGSVFELTAETWENIRAIAKKHNVNRLFFESHYSYKSRLQELYDFFPGEIIVKCGIETFDHHFRNDILKKGVFFEHICEVSDYFKSVCILVGIVGQTRDMIERDVEILLSHFPYGCINLYCNNTTGVKADIGLQQWFRDKYSKLLAAYDKIDVLWNNTDFGIGDV